jgi:hypothetical protein
MTSTRAKAVRLLLLALAIAALIALPIWLGTGPVLLSL